MEVNIDMLPSYEKGSYKMEVLEFRRQYEYVREQYFDIDKGYEADRLERENDPIFWMERDIRAKAVGGVTKLND